MSPVRTRLSRRPCRSWSSRWYLAPLVGALAVAVLDPSPGPAHADLGTGGTGGNTGTTLSKEDFEFVWERLDEKTWVFMSATDLELFFNGARCECNTNVRLRVGVTQAGRQKLVNRTDRPGTMKVYVGTNCASEMVRQTMVCQKVAETTEIFELVNGPLFIEIPMRTIFAPVNNEVPTDGGAPAPPPASACATQGSQTITVWIDADSNNIPDLVDSAAPTTGITFDGEPPRPPRIRDVQGGNEALEVRWDSVSNMTGFQGYVVFCSRGGDTAVFKKGSFSPSYLSAARLAADGECPTMNPAVNVSAALQDSTADSTADAGTQAAPAIRGPAPEPFRTLNPDFACSPLLTSDTRRRIFRLQNGIPYLVGVASVDKQGNASPISEVLLQRPTPTIDFYRDYRAEGGTAEGGFCAVAPGGRSGAWLLLGLAGAGVALAVRRLRRRK